MEDSKLVKISLLNSVGVLIYTALVSWIMFNAQRIFGPVKNFTGPLALLLLFIFSATIVGLLVLGRPAYLYFNGSKSEGLKLLFYTIGWLFVFTVVAFAVLLKF